MTPEQREALEALINRVADDMSNSIHIKRMKGYSGENSASINKLFDYQSDIHYELTKLLKQEQSE